MGDRHLSSPLSSRCFSVCRTLLSAVSHTLDHLDEWSCRSLQPLRPCVWARKPLTQSSPAGIVKKKKNLFFFKTKQNKKGGFLVPYQTRMGQRLCVWAALPLFYVCAYFSFWFLETHRFLHLHIVSKLLSLCYFTHAHHSTSLDVIHYWFG